MRGGPNMTTNNAGKRHMINMIISFKGIFAATSSALRYLLVLKESE
jgi:hypothetical protein